MHLSDWIRYAETFGISTQIGDIQNFLFYLYLIPTLNLFCADAHRIMTELLDDQLLTAFVQNFYGYGNYSGQFWFIGMEEGGGNSFSEINNRLTTWENRGKKELEDVADYHKDIGATDWFNDNPRLQPTWNKLIRILLSSSGELRTTEQVREYQKNLLGRLIGDTCLLELLPLPSPSIGQWLYAKYSQLPYLRDRETYKQECLTSRIAHLQNQINHFQPKVVIFYGLSYQDYWKKIARIDFHQNSDKIYAGRNESTLFVMTKHPAAIGVTSDYFHQVGQLIATSLAE
jgi:hypothetical protein